MIQIKNTALYMLIHLGDNQKVEKRKLDQIQVAKA
nr:MAG TPA: hypothetical protein [Caudoviricetes sp.]